MEFKIETSCKDFAAIVKGNIREELSKYKDMHYKLVIIQVGNNKSSDAYVKGKINDCMECGIAVEHYRFPDDVTTPEIVNKIRELQKRDDLYFGGIIVQLPLPEHIDFELIQGHLDKRLDVDGFLHDSNYSPCTPLGIMNWLDYNKINLTGKNVCIVGRSDIVGKPLVNMMIERGATVTCCNSHTENLYLFTSSADIVITAIGKSKYFSETYFRYGQLVIDVGINYDENGKLCGDVDRENVIEKYPNTYVTPVPGGVGLLTRVALLQNVIS